MKQKFLTDDFGYQCLEIRVLPSNGDANTLCGKQGYMREIEHRKYMNQRLGDGQKWKLPAWEDLKIYDSLLTDDY